MYIILVIEVCTLQIIIIINVFNYVKFCAARFARRAVIFLVLYIVYVDGGNIHGPTSL